ncbi:TIGR04222 domain-containing membrane protein [Rhodococcus sp. P1Y]|nr:TIGR04222 domain-containing membrane protein [Rhodococcus sp. P1Y]
MRGMINSAQQLTWGIDGPTFLRWYLVAALLAIVVPAAISSSTRGNGRALAPSRVLTPPEVGALTSDYQALIASLSVLRAAGTLAPGGRKARPLTAEERSKLDWFTRIVSERIGSGTRPPSKASLINSLSVTFAQLRGPLLDMGYLTGSHAARAAKFRVGCVLVVVTIGAARVIARIAGGKPVGYLVLAIIALLASVPFVRRVPRRTPRGSAELRRPTSDYAHLQPRMRPAFETYGPSHAGMSAALFGGAALLWLDPQLAGAMNAGASTSAGFGGFDGTGGGFDGGGSGSDSGSSGSSCGGGGCGG